MMHLYESYRLKSYDRIVPVPRKNHGKRFFEKDGKNGKPERKEIDRSRANIHSTDNKDSGWTMDRSARKVRVKVRWKVPLLG